jgi:hypothetical protein
MDVDGVEAKAMVVEGPQKKKTEWVQCEDCDKWRKCPLDIVHTVSKNNTIMHTRGRQALTCVVVMM